MKFTSLPKKLLLTGMSAAMVVAFAPAVAQASVSVDPAKGTDQASKTVDATTVATLTYETAATSSAKAQNVTQEFKSNAKYTDDDAFQAALTEAAYQSEKDGVSNVTVTLQKPIEVGNVADEPVKSGVSSYKNGLVASGKNVTIDLNGNTVSNAGDGTLKDKDENGKDGQWTTKDSPVITVKKGVTVHKDAETAAVANTVLTPVYSGIANVENIVAAVKTATEAKGAADKAYSEAKGVTEEKQTAFDTASGNYKSAKEADDAAQKKLGEAQLALTHAQADLADVNAKTDATEAEKTAAQDAVTKAEEDVKAAETAQGDTAQKLSQATGARDSAQTELNTAQQDESSKKAAAESAATAEKNALETALSEFVNKDNVNLKDVVKADDFEAISVVKSDEGNEYVLNDTKNGFTNTSKNSKEATEQTYTQYTLTLVPKVKTKETKAAEDKVIDDAIVTIQHGTVSSTTGEEAVVVEKDATATLGGKDATNVITTKAPVAISNAGTLNLTNGTDVEVSYDEDTNGDGTLSKDEQDNAKSVVAISGNDVAGVTIAKGDVNVVDSRKDAEPYDTAAKVNVSLKNAVSGQVAVGIGGRKVTTEATVDVDVTSQAAHIEDAKAGQTQHTGLIPDGSPSVEGKAGSTYAVMANRAQLGYGDYTADFAVVAQTPYYSYINYGSYEGYVTGISKMASTDTTTSYESRGISISGGTFKYDPTKTIDNGKTGDSKVYYQFANTLCSYKDYADSDVYQLAENSANTATPYYVYRLGTASAKTTFYNGAVETKTQHGEDERAAEWYLQVVAPKGTKGSLNKYVQDNYLDKATQEIVFAKTGKRGDLGTSLNDGNSQKEQYGVDQPTLNLQLTGLYGTPTKEAADETKTKGTDYSAAYATLAQKAADNTQTAQGVYGLRAEQQYGLQKAKDGKSFTDKAAKVADVADLGDAKVALNASLVSTYADAKAYDLSDGSDVDLTVSPAVGSTIHGIATFETAKAGDYGITVTTTSDAVKQADAKAAAAQAAAEQKAAEAQAAAEQKAAEAQAAAEAAQKAADEAAAKATSEAQAAQQAAEQKAAEAQAAADAAKAQADAAQAKLAQQQAVAKAKAKQVKGVKAVAGKKKATVSWKKVSGAKSYQIQYRVYRNTSTAQYKTVKASKVKKTLTGLKSGKGYRIKVRAKFTVNGKTVNGKWSKAVSADVK